MMTVDQLTDLLMKHLQGNLSGPEQELLNHWLLQSDRNRVLFESIHDEEQLRQLVLLYDEEEAENNEALILSKIRQQIAAETPVRRMGLLRRWGWAAAAILLAAGIGGYLLQNRKEAAGPVAVHQADIPPGKEGAVLTLSDGSQVVLDSLGNGVIAIQNGAQVSLKNGELAYTGEAGSGEVVYNNLTTPKGRQFQILLPDGTKVWLNAASSLRYPTAFSGKNREVEVTGEAYFDVAKNAHEPFIIHLSNQTTIQVLGTQFNVNAYSNEKAIRTTLVEGSIKIISGTSVVLKPGQQAETGHAAGEAIKVLNDADVDKAVAWKSGLFNFEDSGLEEVMRQVERWYDIEVVYEKGIPDIRFGGKLSNDVSLSGLIRSLQDAEVHFRIEGRKLIVLP